MEIFFHYVKSTTEELGGLSETNIEKPDVTPTFVILDDDSSEPTEEMYYIRSDAVGYVFGFIEFKVLLHERYELHRFPFDRQNFQLEFECLNGSVAPWSCPVVPDDFKDELKDVVSSNFVGVCESESWELNRVIMTQPNPDSCRFKIGMTRLSPFYITNIFFPIFMIVQIAVLTSAVETSDFGTRFSCMLTLLLTIVAFKFVTASYVPKVSYQTFLDSYTMLAYLFLVVWMFENFFISGIFEIDQEVADRVDDTIGAIYSVNWITINAVIVIGAYFGWFNKTWESVDIDDAFVRVGTRIAHDKFA